MDNLNSREKIDWNIVLEEVFSYYVRGYALGKTKLPQGFFEMISPKLEENVETYLDTWSNSTSGQKADFKDFNFTAKAIYVFETIFKVDRETISFLLSSQNKKAMEIMANKMKINPKTLSLNSWNLPNTKYLTKDEQKITEELNFFATEEGNEKLLKQDEDELFDASYHKALQAYDEKCDRGDFDHMPVALDSDFNLTEKRENEFKKRKNTRRKNFEAWKEKQIFGGRFTYVLEDQIISSKDFSENGIGLELQHMKLAKWLAEALEQKSKETGENFKDIFAQESNDEAGL